ncbi:MAG TPA: hypothetical protein VNH18_31035, partial [Bryobacteraceae bacterium]|nr:hypothetical protein [Bryobacteraceae bacterium]
LTFNTNGTVSGTSSFAFDKYSAKRIADYMAEQNIPAFDGVNYCSIFRPTPLRPLKNDLEAINQYTPEGWHVIMNGEKGRYEGIRFVEQTNVPVAVSATGGTFANTDRGFFFGSDTVTEVFAIPEEIRGKIPTDFGRSRGIAWYAELAFGIAHTEIPGTRILCWDSQA